MSFFPINKRNPKDLCPICIEHLGFGRVSGHDAIHAIHKKCLDDLLAFHRGSQFLCPLCKTVITKIETDLLPRKEPEKPAVIDDLSEQLVAQLFQNDEEEQRSQRHPLIRIYSQMAFLQPPQLQEDARPSNSTCCAIM